MDHPKITAVFHDGPLGCKFNHEGEVIAIKRGTQADAVPGLMKRDLLVSVGAIGEGSTGRVRCTQLERCVGSSGKPVTEALRHSCLLGTLYLRAALRSSLALPTRPFERSAAG